ncbi:MAG: hypothetical protein WDM77_18675 [Steroidobacteraceae bacterium]
MVRLAPFWAPPPVLGAAAGLGVGMEAGTGAGAGGFGCVAAARGAAEEARVVMGVAPTGTAGAAAVTAGGPGATGTCAQPGIPTTTKAATAVTLTVHRQTVHPARRLPPVQHYP